MSNCKELQAEVLRLRAENAQLVAANQALLVKEAEARELLEYADTYLGPSKLIADWLDGKESS